MQNVLAARPARSTGLPVDRNTPGVTRRPFAGGPDNTADRQFVAMLDSYRGHGGLARVQELLALSRRVGGPDLTTLARWIVKRDVICFEWQAQSWFPWFQLNRSDLAPDPQLRAVFAELTPVYDQWELAHWFSRPNPWLENHSPVEMLACDLSAVLVAARADRFIANG